MTGNGSAEYIYVILDYNTGQQQIGYTFSDDGARVNIGDSPRQIEARWKNGTLYARVR